MSIYKRPSLGWENQKADYSDIGEYLNAPVVVPQPPPEESGYIGGTVKSLARGVLRIPEAAGNALEYNREAKDTGDESRYGVLNRLGHYISSAAEGVRESIPQAEPRSNLAKRALFEGSESIPLSLGYAVPSYLGATAAGALGTPTGPGAIATAAGGAALGQALMYPIMQRSTAQETYEQIRKSRPEVSPQQASDIANKTGHWEAGPEAAANVAEGVIYSMMPGGRVAKTGVDVLRNMFKPGLKQFGKNALKSYAFEAPSEALTAYKQTQAMNEVMPEGMQEDPKQAALWSLAPTAVMTGAMGGAGTVLQRFKGANMAKVLSDPLAADEGGNFHPQEVQNRIDLAGMVHGEIKARLGEEAATNWQANSLQRIANNEPIPFDESMFLPAAAEETETPVIPPEINQGGTVDLLQRGVPQAAQPAMNPFPVEEQPVDFRRPDYTMGRSTANTEGILDLLSPKGQNAPAMPLPVAPDISMQGRRARDESAAYDAWQKGRDALNRNVGTPEEIALANEIETQRINAQQPVESPITEGAITSDLSELRQEDTPNPAQVSDLRGEEVGVQEPAPLTNVEQKQPWEMTREEFVAFKQEELRKKAVTIGKNGREIVNKSLMSRSKSPGFAQTLAINHAERVKKAIAERANVPPEVLAEYPEIQQQSQQAANREQLIAKGKGGILSNEGASNVETQSNGGTSPEVQATPGMGESTAEIEDENQRTPGSVKAVSPQGREVTDSDLSFLSSAHQNIRDIEHDNHIIDGNRASRSWSTKGQLAPYLDTTGLNKLQAMKVLSDASKGIFPKKNSVAQWRLIEMAIDHERKIVAQLESDLMQDIDELAEVDTSFDFGANVVESKPSPDGKQEKLFATPPTFGKKAQGKGVAEETPMLTEMKEREAEGKQNKLPSFSLTSPAVTSHTTENPNISVLERDGYFAVYDNKAKNILAVAQMAGGKVDFMEHSAESRQRRGEERFQYEQWVRDAAKGNGKNTPFSLTSEATDKPAGSIEKLTSHFTDNGIDLAGNVEAVTVEGKQSDNIRKVAELFGQKVTFVKWTGQQLFNGVVLPNDRENIYISVESSKPHMVVAGHEVLHQLSNKYPLLYKQLQRNLATQFKDFQAFMDGINRQREAAGLEALPYNGASEELIADFLGEQMTNPDFWKKLGKVNPSLFQKVAKFLVDVYNKIFNVSRPTDSHFKDLQKAQDILAQAISQFSEATGKVDEQLQLFAEKYSLNNFNTELLVNPTASELHSLLRDSQYKELRVVKDPETGDVFVADAGKTYHKFMAQRAGLNWSQIDGKPEYMFTVTSKDLGKAINYGGAKYSLTAPAVEYLRNIDTSNLTASIGKLLNPLDFSRSKESVARITPQSLQNAVGYYLGNPVFQAERDPMKKDFVDTAIQREEVRAQTALDFKGFKGATGEHPGVFKRLGEVYSSYEDVDASTDWGRIQKAALKLSKNERKAIDVMLVQGDMKGAEYKTLAAAKKNKKIAAANPTEAAFQVYRSTRDHINTTVADALEKYIRQLGKEAELDSDTIEKHIANFRAKLAKRPGWMPRNHGEGDRMVNVYHIIEDFKFEMKSTEDGNGHQAFLPYYAGNDATKMLRKMAADKALHFKLLPNGEAVITAKGDTVQKLEKVLATLEKKLDKPTMYESDTEKLQQRIDSIRAKLAMVQQPAEKQLADFIADTDSILPALKLKHEQELSALQEQLDNAETPAEVKRIEKEIENLGDGRVKVKRYMRLQTTEGNADRHKKEVEADIKKYMPEGYRDGEKYEVSTKFNPKLTESTYGDMKSDFSVESAQLAAVKKMENAGEIGKQEAASLRRNIVRATAEVLMARGAGQRQIRRAPYLIEGYNNDEIIQEYDDYMNGTAGMISKALYARDQFDNFRYSDDEVKPWAEKYIKDSLRNMGTWDRASGNARSVATFMFLGFRVSSMLINATQVYTLGVAELGMHTKKSALLAIARAQKDIVKGKLSKEEKELFASHIWKLQEMETAVHEMSGSNEGITGKVSKHLHILTQKALAPFQEVELMNRRTMILAAYRVLKADGMSKEDAIAKALEINRKVNFEMSRANLPGFARNAVGRTVYALQSFMWNNLNWLYNRATGGTKQDMLALLRYGGMMFLIGGAVAIPGGDELDKLYRKLSGRSIKLDWQQWSKKRAKEYGDVGLMLNDFAWHGVTSAAGINISNAIRLQIPIVSNLLSGDSVMESATGVFSGIAQKGATAVRAAAKGDKYRAVEAIAPEFISSPMRAYRQANRGVTTLSGKPVFDENGKPLKYSESDMAKRAIGFQPIRQSERMDVTQTGKALKEQWNEMRQDLIDSFRIADTKSERQKVMRDILKFNTDLRKSQARGLVLSIKRSTLERAIESRVDKKMSAFQKKLL